MSKLVMITGATSGIGLATAKLLAQKGHHIIGLGRSEDKCYRAIQEIRKTNIHSDVRYFIADLSKQADIRRVCGEITQYIDDHGGALDCLINNAGTFSTFYRVTEDGFESQFAVNHLAHFLMTQLMMPKLRNSLDAKVLTTSSGSHYGARIDINEPMLTRNYSQLKAYKQTKLMNVLFTYEFNRRYEGGNVQAFAVDPGLVNTSMGDKNTAGLAKWIWSIRRNGGTSTEEGAKTLVYLASEPVNEVNCFYYKDCRAKAPNRRALNTEVACKLWDLSTTYCGLGKESA